MADQLPAQCALDRTKLDTIAVTVEKISGQMDALTDMEGPIARLDKRVDAVESSDRRAHERINTVETKQQEDHDTITRWVAKAVAITGAVLTILGLAGRYLLP